MHGQPQTIERQPTGMKTCGDFTSPKSAPAMLALVLGWACTDASLQPYQPPAEAVPDDEIRLEAELCTSAEKAVFPVKVLLVVDTSDSMRVTDEARFRAVAVRRLLERYAGSENVQFGVIAFDSVVQVLTQRPDSETFFTTNPDVNSITNRLNQADRLTDYQGALGKAYSVLSQDMRNLTPAERSRTKYVVIFFTDGTPDPQCSADESIKDFRICNLDRERWGELDLGEFSVDDVYPLMVAEKDYNTREQVLRSVSDIVSLQDFYHVGEVRMHTALLYDERAVTLALAKEFNLDRTKATELLTAMKDEGGGTFTEFTAASNIDFLKFNYTSLKAPTRLRRFFAVNTSAILTPGGLAADTDGDGLTDDEEFAIGTCRGKGCSDTPADSDGDGFSDFLEHANRVSGFDPLDAKKPGAPCSAWDGGNGARDRDGDGLPNCEEVFLGTDRTEADTDGDGLSDLVEVRAGLDPLDGEDVLTDLDHDGAPNADEVVAHLDPLSAAQPGLRDRYLYSAAATESPDGRICYEVAANHVRLLDTTGKDYEQDLLGGNRVLLHFLEVPDGMSYGTLRSACVDVRYLGRLKFPPGGVVRLGPDAFKENWYADKTCLDCTGATGADCDLESVTE
ncbi:MAG: VWA domain-containing protein [Pseudomonadota bacterium]